MASRCRTLSRPAFNLIKSTLSKPTLKPNFSIHTTSSIPTLSRPLPQMGALQSLLPLYSAVSSARLTSCLGLDSKGSRSLSQGIRSFCASIRDESQRLKICFNMASYDMNLASYVSHTSPVLNFCILYRLIFLL